MSDLVLGESPGAVFCAGWYPGRRGRGWTANPALHASVGPSSSLLRTFTPPILGARHGSPFDKNLRGGRPRLGNRATQRRPPRDAYVGQPAHSLDRTLIWFRQLASTHTPYSSPGHRARTTTLQLPCSYRNPIEGLPRFLPSRRAQGSAQRRAVKLRPCSNRSPALPVQLGNVLGFVEETRTYMMPSLAVPASTRTFAEARRPGKPLFRRGLRDRERRHFP